MVFKVGITGGIGSGKSVVCEIFSLLGIPIFNSDTHARSILESDEKVIREIKNIFGESSYTIGNKPDRKLIASMAFGDAGKLSKLNAVVHPAVSRCFQEWVKNNDQCEYVIKEAAILVESGAYKDLDFLVLVSAPEELRLSRAASRDRISKEEVKQRTRNQWTEDKLRKYVQHEIKNNEIELLIPQVLKLHEILKKEASKK